MPKLAIYMVSVFLALGLAIGPAGAQTANDPTQQGGTNDAGKNASDTTNSTSPTGATKIENNEDKADKARLQRPGGNTTVDESGNRCEVGTPDEKNCNPAQED
jgi:hypothetical protein